MTLPLSRSETGLQRRQVLRGAAAGLSLAGMGASSMLGCASDPPPVDEVPHAHPLEGLQTMAGDPAPLPRMIHEVTLIDFWASWCAPCRDAFRYLDQLYRTFVGDGLTMVAISVDETLPDARNFAARMRVHFPLAWDPEGKIRGRFLVENLPTTVLLDANARVIHRHSGFDLQNHRILEEHVRRLVRNG